MANEISIENLSKENSPSKLLSFLNENYIMALKEQFSMEYEKRKRKTKQSYSIIEIEDPSNSDYGDIDDALEEGNNPPNTNNTQEKV